MTEPLPPTPHRGAAATESGEDQVLAGLYGTPDAEGVYRGDPQSHDLAHDLAHDLRGRD